MREYLFQGKRKDNGEWISGDLRQWSETSTGICDRDLKRTFPVRPETVGQYTGLTDKNGKRIFEGDVVRYTETDARGNWICTDIVEFTEGSFSPIPTSYSCGDEYYSFALHSFEVIGNRWDNPELLKGGASNG